MPETEQDTVCLSENRSVYMTFGKRQEKVKFRKRKRIAYAILKLSSSTDLIPLGTLT